ncbi:hypothetical protein P7K49_020320 [Saguinus oedipus]|uniref:L-serine deaminase n=1 Tax=Saguinus oedipus TaxID=9490 RepID=A0ABQ9V1Q6_SAGOE|nr:hypothetical protein P7K49_020320 [Saguinus oedipus]
MCAHTTREGHTSIIKELKEALGAKPGAIALSVGGGGLLCGVVQGLQEVGWGDVPVIAMETFGAHSFHAATTAGKLVSLPKITRKGKGKGKERKRKRKRKGKERKGKERKKKERKKKEKKKERKKKERKKKERKKKERKKKERKKKERKKKERKKKERRKERRKEGKKERERNPALGWDTNSLGTRLVRTSSGFLSLASGAAVSLTIGTEDVMSECLLLTMYCSGLSVAKALGVKTVGAQALKLFQEHPIFSEVISDQEAVAAIEKFVELIGSVFPSLANGLSAPRAPGKLRPHPYYPLSLADDEKILVEPACGAALAAVYSHVVQKLQREGKLPAPLPSLVVIVCGGSNISLAQLWTLKEQLGMTNGLLK